MAWNVQKTGSIYKLRLTREISWNFHLIRYYLLFFADFWPSNRRLTIQWSLSAHDDDSFATSLFHFRIICYGAFAKSVSCMCIKNCTVTCHGASMMCGKLWNFSFLWVVWRVMTQIISRLLAKKTPSIESTEDVERETWKISHSICWFTLRHIAVCTRKRKDIIKWEKKVFKVFIVKKKNTRETKTLRLFSSSSSQFSERHRERGEKRKICVLLLVVYFLEFFSCLFESKIVYTNDD